MHRFVTLILAVLLLLLQYPLWIGKGSWLKVWDINRQLEAQQQVNQQASIRNSLLDADVRDLKQGTEAIEERARSELGMIKPDEVFYQIVEKPSAQMPTAQMTENHATASSASAISGTPK